MFRTATPTLGEETSMATPSLSAFGKTSRLCSSHILERAGLVRPDYHPKHPKSLQMVVIGLLKRGRAVPLCGRSHVNCARADEGLCTLVLIPGYRV